MHLEILERKDIAVSQRSSSSSLIAKNSTLMRGLTSCLSMTSGIRKVLSNQSLFGKAAQSFTRS